MTINKIFDTTAGATTELKRLETNDNYVTLDFYIPVDRLT
jgi:hypothetical protein